MKVALVHDFLAQNGGAEKVLEVLHEMFPEAPIYTLLYDRKKVPQFKDCDVRTSFIDKWPLAHKKYQWYLPWMPLATESYDLSEFDIVISSVSALAKGVITKPDTIHICYCHTPTRYLWSDTHRYVEELKLPKLVKKTIPNMLSKIRLWDRLAADRVDFFIANSHTVEKRIQKYYQKPSEVIYPPVELTRFSIGSGQKSNYFLTGGRLVSYKRYDLTIKAFNRLGIPLKIFGRGPMLDKLKSMAKPHIEFLGFVSPEEQVTLFQEAQAFIHPQVEDFGITAVEPMACGTPVIAYGEGGAVETVIDGKTGLIFDEQRWEAIADKVIRFNSEKFDPKEIHQHAQKFDKNVFKQKLTNFINEKLEERTS